MAFIIGALVPTFLISRLILWLMRSWQGGVRRLALAHCTSLLLAAFIGGMGLADGGAFAGAEAALSYSLPQAFWFAVDLYRYRRANKALVRQSAGLPANATDDPQHPT